MTIEITDAMLDEIEAKAKKLVAQRETLGAYMQKTWASFQSMLQPGIVLALVAEVRRLKASLSHLESQWGPALRTATATARRQALEEAAEEVNGVEPAILDGKSELFTSIYCRARVDAAAAIRVLKDKEPGQ